MAVADGWLIDEWTALAVLLAVSMPVAVHAGELVQAQSGRRIRIRTKISGRDIVSDTDLAVERRGRCLVDLAGSTRPGLSVDAWIGAARHLSRNPGRLKE